MSEAGSVPRQGSLARELHGLLVEVQVPQRLGLEDEHGRVARRRGQRLVAEPDGFLVVPILAAVQ